MKTAKEIKKEIEELKNKILNWDYNNDFDINEDIKLYDLLGYARGRLDTLEEKGKRLEDSWVFNDELRLWEKEIAELKELLGEEDLELNDIK